MLQARGTSTGTGTGAHRPSAERPRAALIGLTLIGLLGGGVLIGLGSEAGCSAQTGMYCQQQSDCRIGLVCNKPRGARPESYGICEPARRGTGEACVRSSDCEVGLICSSEIGAPSPDERHGLCMPGGGSDGGNIDAGASD